MRLFSTAKWLQQKKKQKTKTQDQTCIFHPAPGPKSKDFCLYYGPVGSNTLVIDTEIA